MQSTFIASSINKLNDDLFRSLRLFNSEEMSMDYVNPSRIPRKHCQCVHHKITIPCPATANPKLKPKCCYCKKNRPDRPKSSEKHFVAVDETMAGEPQVDKSELAENMASFDKFEVDELQRELSDEKQKVNELEKNLNILRGENETLERRRADTLAQMSSLQEELSKFKAENVSIKRECEDLKEQILKLTTANNSITLECDDLKEQISKMTSENKFLRRESEDLQSKLKSVEEREIRRNSEIADEVKKWRSVIKEKEDSLTNDKNELNSRIQELTNTVKQQKKNIYELTTTCAKHKSKLEESEKKLSSKAIELTDTDKRLKSKCCECKDLQEEIENLKRCLNEESKAADDFKKEMDECKDNCKCELLTKEKIIEVQNETIKKLKNILHNNEKISQQAAREYESLSDELYSMRKENHELKIALEEVAENFESKTFHQCLLLEDKLNRLSEKNQQALEAARYTAKKLCEATDEFQSQLISEKQQHDFLMFIVKQKEQQIECLKREIHYLRLRK